MLILEVPLVAVEAADLPKEEAERVDRTECEERRDEDEDPSILDVYTCLSTSDK